MSRLKASIMILTTINILYMAVGSLTYPVIPLYLTSLNMDIVMISNIVAILSASSFISQILWGWMSDKVEYKAYLIATGSALTCIAYALSALTNSLLFLVLLWILANVSGSAAFTPSMALVADEAERGDMGKAMGLFWAGGSLGWAFPLLFAGYLLEEYGINMILALCALLSGTITLLTLETIRRGTLRLTSRRIREEKLRLRDVLSPALMTLYLTSLIFYIGDLVKNIYVPQFHVRELKLETWLTTFILSLASWAEIPLLILFGVLVDIIGSKNVFLLGLTTAAAYLFMNSMTENAIEAICVMIFYGIVWASFSSSSSTLITEIVGEERRGIALGILNANFSLASIIGPPMIGPLIAIYGFRTCFNMLSTALLISALLVSLFIRPHSRKPSRERG